MKISLCIEPLFTDYPFAERVEIARACGADAVEFWDARAHDLKALEKACERADMPIAACSLFESWEVRLNGALERVLKNLEESIRIGKDLGCRRFIGLAGNRTADPSSQQEVLVANLSRVAEIAEKNDVIVLVEALNSLYDHIGYGLDRASDGIKVMRQVNSASVRLLYDVYHMQLMEGNLVNTIRNAADVIGHYHFAGVPGRHEPQNGEINYPAVVQAINASGYADFCGLEYWPSYADDASVSDSISYLRKSMLESND